MKTSFQWRLPLFGLMCRCKSLARLVALPPPSCRLKNNRRLLNRIPCLFSSDHVTIIDVASLLHQSSFPTGWKTTMTNITIKWYKLTQQIQIQTTMTKITIKWDISIRSLSSVNFPEKVGQMIFHISSIFLGFRFLFCPRMTLLWPLWRTKPHRCEERKNLSTILCYLNDNNLAGQLTM